MIGDEEYDRFPEVRLIGATLSCESGYRIEVTSLTVSLRSPNALTPFSPSQFLKLLVASIPSFTEAQGEHVGSSNTLMLLHYTRRLDLGFFTYPRSTLFSGLIRARKLRRMDRSTSLNNVSDPETASSELSCWPLEYVTSSASYLYIQTSHSQRPAFVPGFEPTSAPMGHSHGVLHLPSSRLSALPRTHPLSKPEV